MKTHEVTVNAEKMMHLQDYGIAPGCYASFVLRRRRMRWKRFACGRIAWKKGTLLAETAAVVAKLRLDKRPKEKAFQLS